MNTTTGDKNLSTADFAAAAEHREVERDTGRDARDERQMELDQPVEASRRGEEMRDASMPSGSGAAHTEDEPLAPLFLPQIAESFRARWDDVQIGFVDNPTEAVKKADELVAQVMKSLAETFADEREHIEGQVDQSDTEHLRVALRRYRSFFQRLLSL
jgi:hypothetical protein